MWQYLDAAILNINTVSGFVTVYQLLLCLSIYQIRTSEMRVILLVPEAILKDNGMIHSI